MDYRIIIGLTSILLAIIAYIFYFKDIFKGRTKPHTFSWLVWTILSSIAFAGQYVEGAGPGAWATGATAIICLVVLVLSFWKGEKDIKTSDWISLGAAGVALFLWYLTNTPIWSIILVSVTDALGFFPTFRKSYFKPYEETATMFTLNGIKFFISIFALKSFTLTTWLYPASLTFTNLAFPLMLVIRRKQLKALH